MGALRDSTPDGTRYGLRRGVGPYTDGNSEIRKFYRERRAEVFPVDLWRRIADEAGPYAAWLRCTGGGEPMLHPHMVDCSSPGARAPLWTATLPACPSSFSNARTTRC